MTTDHLCLPPDCATEAGEQDCLPQSKVLDMEMSGAKEVE